MEKSDNSGTGIINEIKEQGYCVLRNHFPSSLIIACREAFWPVLTEYIEKNKENSNRGAHRHFIPMPFHPPCFAPDFFFNKTILHIVQALLGPRILIDQWGCDVPLKGSVHQDIHADFQRPLFPEIPDLQLPAYMLMVSFGLMKIDMDKGPIEIAAGTHLLSREEGINKVKSGLIRLVPVTLEIGDVLIRHPWTLHRGTPNLTSIPRALVSLRYVRNWYADQSREVNPVPLAIWKSLDIKQQNLMRFPLEG